MQVRWRDIIDEINSTAERYLLGVSGGIDSMFMLDFFHRNCAVPFRVVHFNHGLRDVAADEEDFVRASCERRDLGVIVGYGDPDAMRAARSLEAEARDQRYAFMNSVRRDDELIVTAHHANDQLETVLMRLMRGYPSDQLRMRKRTADKYRPFLMVTRADVETQARNRRIEWMEDESNADVAHERNWMRHVIIPQLMERRNILKTIALQDGEDARFVLDEEDFPDVADDEIAGPAR
ncbi:tRNA lysidine(34) synthetase TilS [Rhizobium leguminosarum]|uniref:tRNA lysidine(34) synthetase TilS n=1 Tax=Rhizobium leguminosarum TaxID=384 RepID=UPI002E0D66D8|nr:tRNA lysidine(34) synthetase TilS [Rhizobium leguminosarum]WSH77123.1 tRNA lysidine(34) synthetase TilS [Rhizobium leguminosarum]